MKKGTHLMALGVEEAVACRVAVGVEVEVKMAEGDGKLVEDAVSVEVEVKMAEGDGKLVEDAVSVEVEVKMVLGDGKLVEDAVGVEVEVKMVLGDGKLVEDAVGVEVMLVLGELVEDKEFNGVKVEEDDALPEEVGDGDGEADEVAVADLDGEAELEADEVDEQVGVLDPVADGLGARNEYSDDTSSALRSRLNTRTSSMSPPYTLPVYPTQWLAMEKKSRATVQDTGRDHLAVPSTYTTCEFGG
jgi:hypothetical protein